MTCPGQLPRASASHSRETRYMSDGWTSRSDRAASASHFSPGCSSPASSTSPISRRPSSPAPATPPARRRAASRRAPPALSDLSQAFAAVAEQVKPSVVFIKSGKKAPSTAASPAVRGPAGIRAVLPPRSAPATRSRIPGKRRIRLHRLARRLHPDQRPRGGRLGQGHRPAARPPRVQRQGGRHRPQHRPRGAQDRRGQPHAGPARRQRRVTGRRMGARRRQSRSART